MKKILSLTLILLLAVGMLAGCGGGNGGADDQQSDKTKVYNIATDTTFAPFEFQNDAGE